MRAEYPNQLDYSGLAGRVFQFRNNPRIGAVRFGWLGFFIGIIIMSASNIIISLDNIGPALAVALLTPFYGYFIKILTNVIVYRMDYNKLIEELNEEKLEN